MDTNVITGRLMRVLRFDASVYREIAADQNAMMQAGIVVTLAAIIAAISEYYEGVLVVIIVAIVSIIGFFIYTAVATGISKFAFQGKTSFNEMGRTLGYAYAWYALGILALVPVGGGFLAWIGSIVAWVAGIIALRESAEFETWKAVVTVIVAGIIAAFVTGLIAAPLLLMLGFGEAD